MWNIDVKIAVMKWFLPKWFVVLPHEAKYSTNDHRMHYTWIFKKHAITIKANYNELWCSIEQPQGNTLYWRTNSNFLGFYFAHSGFVNFLYALKKYP